jgi:hypothetical protein
MVSSHPRGRAVSGMGLRPLALWDFGFKSCREHGRLSIVFLFSDKSSLRRAHHSSRGVLPGVACLSVILKRQKMRRSRPTRGFRGVKKVL